MKRGPLVFAGVLAFVVLAGGTFAIRARRGVLLPVVVAARISDSLKAPAGVRIKVEVVNTTKTRGLARRATQLLRDRGFDVVDVETGGPLRDTTLVLDRSGHAAWASTIARIIGAGARWESRPDSSRYLDITVLLGSSWHPSAEPLNP